MTTTKMRHFENRHVFYEPNCFYGNKKVTWAILFTNRFETICNMEIEGIRPSAHFILEMTPIFTINNFMEYFDGSRIVAL